MRVCNCILPTIHGSDVCNKCQNNNDSHNEYVMDMTDINKYTKMAEDCGFGIIPTRLEVKEKCEYCEVELENKHNNSYNFEDAKFCRMCGRKL